MCPLETRLQQQHLVRSLTTPMKVVLSIFLDLMFKRSKVKEFCILILTVKLWIWSRLVRNRSVSLHSLSAILPRGLLFFDWMCMVTIDHPLKLIPVVICYCSIVLFRSGVMIEIVFVEEIKSCLVTTVDENSQLWISKLIFFKATSIVNRLDERYLNRVLFNMNPCSAIVTEKNSIVNTDVVNFMPTWKRKKDLWEKDVNLPQSKQY